MYKILLLLSLSVTTFISSYAGSFTSVGSGNYHDPATWLVVGDADEIPDNDDDIVINTGHVVTVVVLSRSNNVTVDGTLSVSSGSPLYISGNYIVNGIETGNGGIGFVGTPGGTISGSGTFGSTVRYSFSRNTTIAAGIDISKNANIGMSIGPNVTVTNNGTMTAGTVAGNSGATIVNTATGYLKITQTGHYTSNFRIDASAVGNTVDFTYSNASGNIKTPIGNSFHNLRISGNTTKSIRANITVNGNMSIISGSGFNFQGNNLTVKGDLFVGTNTYTQQSASLLTLNGTSAQSFQCGGAFTTIIPNLIIDNAAGVNTVSGIVQITNTLTVINGNFDLGTNRITLVSDATSTAYIAESNGTFSGSMNIQRFVTARNDGYSDMSSPLSNGTFAQLSDDFATLFAPYVPNSSSPSAWGYDESIWDYVAIETSGTAMVPGVGYEVYLDNDGSASTSFSATTVDFSGTPNIGNIDVNVTADNDGWNLIGNPYASHINYDTWYDDNDPFGLAMGADFLYYDENVEDFVFGFYGDGEELAAGQGFWIETFVANTLTFSENQKTTSTSSSTFRQAKRELFGLKVKSHDIKYSSHTYFRFDNTGKVEYEQGIDKGFLKVPAKEAPSLFTLADSKKLKLNHLYPENSMSIPIHFIAGKNASYSISAVDLAAVFEMGYSQVVLEDLFNGNLYDLTNGEYSFEATTSDEPNRFVLHLSNGDSNSNYENQVSFVNSNNGVFVNFNFDSNTNAVIDVFNVAGQEIVESKNINTSNQTVGLQIPQDYQGMYIIRVIINEKVITQRFYKN